jgi:hypothetical protein
MRLEIREAMEKKSQEEEWEQKRKIGKTSLLTTGKCGTTRHQRHLDTEKRTNEAKVECKVEGAGVRREKIGEREQ